MSTLVFDAPGTLEITAYDDGRALGRTSVDVNKRELEHFDSGPVIGYTVRLSEWKRAAAPFVDGPIEDVDDGSGDSAYVKYRDSEGHRRELALRLGKFHATGPAIVRHERPRAPARAATKTSTPIDGTTIALVGVVVLGIGGLVYFLTKSASPTTTGTTPTTPST